MGGTATSRPASLYVRYVDSMDSARAAGHYAWQVQGYRHDVYAGRWEIALGTGRHEGPFPTPIEAMEQALVYNRTLAQTPHVR